ncbi:unnamed protein product [Cochlearia groenlandica]
MMIDYERCKNINHLRNSPPPSSSSHHLSGGSIAAVIPKRKRRPAGTPGFQRDQNLQMHRRKHKVPWKLIKRDNTNNNNNNNNEQEAKKRVYVCPEPTCLHNNPSHALGDLVGIKKHFKRKHSKDKQWICEKCSKGYAVQCDYKAHIKTCGTRGHSCDCGRVFSRVESFIEHQDNCTIRQGQSQPSSHRLQTANVTQTASTAENDHNLDLSSGHPILSGHPLLRQSTPTYQQFYPYIASYGTNGSSNIKLKQLLPISKNGTDETSLRLSIGMSTTISSYEKRDKEGERRETKREIEIAEKEFDEAKRVRQNAKVELHKAKVYRREASMRISATLMQITCHDCKQRRP